MLQRNFVGSRWVILSVSLDSNEQKWREFIGKNEMTWPLDPHTFTIDVDGVIQEEHVGDASIEGKLKKLLAHARELQPTETTSSKQDQPGQSCIEFRSTAPVREVESVLASLSNPIAIEQRRRLASWHRGAP
jgi:hypothetical protein